MFFFGPPDQTTNFHQMWVRCDPALTLSPAAAHRRKRTEDLFFFLIRFWELPKITHLVCLDNQTKTSVLRVYHASLLPHTDNVLLHEHTIGRSPASSKHVKEMVMISLQLSLEHLIGNHQVPSGGSTKISQTNSDLQLRPSSSPQVWNCEVFVCFFLYEPHCVHHNSIVQLLKLL